MKSMEAGIQCLAQTFLMDTDVIQTMNLQIHDHLTSDNLSPCVKSS